MVILGTQANGDFPFQKTRTARFRLTLRASCQLADPHEKSNVLVRGGFPGLAVMVTDVAENTEDKRIYLVAQSYIPAQDFHILKNPSVSIAFPGSFLNEADIFIAPGYIFKKTECKRR